MEMKYRHSKFTNVIEKNQDYIFFNSNSLGLFEASQDDYDIFQTYTEPKELSNDETSLSFVQAGFLIPESFNEYDVAKKERFLRRKISKESSLNRIGYMRISLTELCNLQCKYCFVNDIYRTKGNMDKDSFVSTIHWFIEQNKSSYLRIQYFGGEPLLRMDLIKMGHIMLEKAKNDGIISGYEEEIVTNGTLMNEKKSKYFIDNHFRIIFSIDGWEEINDKNRVYSNGMGSYNAIIKGLDAYQKVGGRIAAILTPSKDNIHLFPKIIRYLVEDLHFQEIHVNTPQPTQDGWDVKGKDFALSIIEAWEYCDSLRIPFIQPGNNIAFLVSNKLPQSNSCMDLTFGQAENTYGVYVTSNNMISSCVVECNEKCTKKIDDFELDKEYIDWHFNDNSSLHCQKCIGYNICGGPCSIESVLRPGKLDSEKCRFFKTLIPWILQR
ncbi:radical SAM protein [Paenibacillus polymyxa]|uniref:radical SAM protein n=1 Tax=Paenibacillus polymyxa TaxID=1406 RepID=UPI000471DDF0|nr:radical SAM protein [Paenibacillus polymyxa]